MTGTLKTFWMKATTLIPDSVLWYSTVCISVRYSIIEQHHQPFSTESPFLHRRNENGRCARHIYRHTYYRTPTHFLFWYMRIQVERAAYSIYSLTEIIMYAKVFICRESHLNNSLADAINTLPKKFVPWTLSIILIGHIIWKEIMPLRHFRKSLFPGHFLLIGHNNLEGGHAVPFELWLKSCFLLVPISNKQQYYTLWPWTNYGRDRELKHGQIVTTVYK